MNIRDNLAPHTTKPPLRPSGRLRGTLHELYFGSTRRARLWQFGLIAFDILTIGYFLVASMASDDPVSHAFDYVLGAILTLDFALRLVAARRPWRQVFQFTTITDLVVIASLFASAFIDNLGFLRVARMLRILRSYHLLRELREVSRFFRRNEEMINSGVNLMVFIFVVTALVFVLEGHRNPSINTYLDALYFTVTTLTTTGFGDITMTDSVGRFMTIFIMVFGVGLFLRLVQTIFRPQKVRHPCPDCGLTRHDPDAVHCKHCGNILNIPTDGED